MQFLVSQQHTFTDPQGSTDICCPARPVWAHVGRRRNTKAPEEKSLTHCFALGTSREFNVNKQPIQRGKHSEGSREKVSLSPAVVQVFSPLLRGQVVLLFIERGSPATLPLMGIVLGCCELIGWQVSIREPERKGKESFTHIWQSPPNPQLGDVGRQLFMSGFS